MENIICMKGWYDMELPELHYHKTIISNKLLKCVLKVWFMSKNFSRRIIFEYFRLNRWNFFLISLLQIEFPWLNWSELFSINWIDFTNILQFYRFESSKNELLKLKLFYVKLFIGWIPVNSKNWFWLTFDLIKK